MWPIVQLLSYSCCLVEIFVCCINFLKVFLIADAHILLFDSPLSGKIPNIIYLSDAFNSDQTFSLDFTIYISLTLNFIYKKHLSH